LLNADAIVEFEVIDPDKRPVAASADNMEIRDITHVKISQDHDTSLTLLFDKEHGLGEKILREQFVS
jgi:NAD+ kinase